jgi:uncharacterized protein YbaP (TraB family)
MPRIQSVVLLVLLFVAMPVFAASPTPMLWKVSKGGSTVYLMGSMHFLKDGDYPLSPDVDAAYKNANKLVFEIAPAEMNSPATAALVIQHGMYPDAKHTLQDDLSAAVWHQVVLYGASNNLPETVLQKLAPWMMAIMMVQIESQRIGMKPEAGLDMHFMKLADTDHKPTSGLETTDQQLSIFYSAPIKDQAEFLSETLDEVADFKKEMDEEHDTWRRGDGDAMAAQAKKEFAKYPDLYKKLVADRNQNWVPQIEKMLGEPGASTLVIVGALHLSGSNGVVSLLRKKGYTVDRICTGCSFKQ